MQKILASLFILILVYTETAGQSLLDAPESGSSEWELNYTLSGYARSVSYLNPFVKDYQPVLRCFYGEAALKIQAGAGSRAGAYSELRFRSGYEWDTLHTVLDVRELYTSISAGPFDLRLGKQVLRAGKGTFYNPEGWFTPLDPTVRSPEEDDIRLGTWAAKLEVHPWTFLNIRALWLPLYTPTQLVTRLLPLPSELAFSAPEFPGMRISDGSYALSLDLRSGFIDFSASWFEGYSVLPGTGLDSILFSMSDYSLQAILLQQYAIPIQAAGADFALPAGPVVIRGEAAWQQCRENRTDAWTPETEFSYTGEIEYNGNKLSLLAGYYGKYLPDFEASTVVPELFSGTDLAALMSSLPQPLSPEMLGIALDEQFQAFNRLYSYQAEASYHTVFGLARFTLLHEQFNIDLPLSYCITSGEYLFRPSIKLSAAGSLEIKAGYSLYYGPENSLFDLLSDPLSGPWLQMKVMF